MQAPPVQPVLENSNGLSTAGPDHQGSVIWITGLSGAGKTTLAREVVRQLKSSTRSTHPDMLPISLDGDAVREAIADPHVGYDRESRLANAMRICRLAQMLSKQGFTVVVSTMSLFKEVHSWNRQHISHYFEVLVRVPLDTLQKRDARKLYSRAQKGEVNHVVGIHTEYDTPEAPHLIVDNDGSEAEIEKLAARLLKQRSRSH